MTNDMTVAAPTAPANYPADLNQKGGVTMQSKDTRVFTVDGKASLYRNALSF